jgi:hypothetical protein
MKTLSVRLPDDLVAQIEAEARRRNLSKSDVVRERITPQALAPRCAGLDTIADLIGSIDGLPSDLSARTKFYLRSKRAARTSPPPRGSS